MTRTLYSFALMTAALIMLGACSSTGEVNTAPPYATERTANYSDTQMIVRKPETVTTQTTTQVQPCDCSAWQNRVTELERELAMCREANRRVQQTYRETLTK